MRTKIFLRDLGSTNESSDESKNEASGSDTPDIYVIFDNDISGDSKRDDDRFNQKPKKDLADDEMTIFQSSLKSKINQTTIVI